jgi:hypothetical protein
MFFENLKHSIQVRKRLPRNGKYCRSRGAAGLQRCNETAFQWAVTRAAYDK